MPAWLVWLSWVSLVVTILSALTIVADILAGHRQNMGIINIVWPVTALWSGLAGVYAYYTIGRLATKRNVQGAQRRGEELPSKKKSYWQMTGEAAMHCGAGCTLGDICAEWLMFAAPLVLFGKSLFGSWVIDYLFAYVFGIIFQYFTIAPMRHLSVVRGLWAAIKADILSLTAWQVGMYGWMAIVTFLLFGHELQKINPVFWLIVDR